jgi:hypothetical protein
MQVRSPQKSLLSKHKKNTRKKKKFFLIIFFHSKNNNNREKSDIYTNSWLQQITFVHQSIIDQLILVKLELGRIYELLHNWIIGEGFIPFFSLITV